MPPKPVIALLSARAGAHSPSDPCARPCPATGQLTQLTCDSLLIRKIPLPCDLDDGFMIHVVLGALRYS